ncbi:MAG: hypothetical protein HFJ17_03120, partial [Clostridia bacterium]|nr:hypothetical protein [Clostridia bacterium]
YHNMLKSVYKNKGFYIGRYEIGIGVANTTEEARNLTRTGVTEYTRSTDTSTSTTVKTNAAPSIEGMNTPISRANTVPYTWITQPQAQMLAKKLGEGSDYNNVNTSLMFGVQWDAVCVFIEKYDKNNTANTTSEWLTKNDYSKLWGNYNRAIFNINQGFYNVYQNPSPYIFPENWKNKDNKVSSGNWLCTTGASDQNSSLNIYDFGGNLSEWTLERHSYPGSPCTYRGGNFISSYCASYHDYNSICSADHSSSARASFYIK